MDKRIVVKTEWYTQLPNRPLIGIVSVWDGYCVKQYIGSTNEMEKIDKSIKEVLEFGGKYREYSKEVWEGLFGTLPKTEPKL